MYFLYYLLLSPFGARDFGRVRRLLCPFFYSFLETSDQGAHSIEYAEVTTGSMPADTSTQPNAERSYECLIIFSNSDHHPVQDPPPPYGMSLG